MVKRKRKDETGIKMIGSCGIGLDGGYLSHARVGHLAAATPRLVGND